MEQLGQVVAMFHVRNPIDPSMFLEKIKIDDCNRKWNFTGYRK